jgi:hypothetical protein
MDLELDHVVVAARTLEEGARWLESQLGCAPAPAIGRHETMGTHNRLLSLGGERYLEIISIDPDAPAPRRPRWFALDTQPMARLLARGPALIHWVMRTRDLEAALASYPEPVAIETFERGPYRWRMALPPDGRLPCGGECPTLIEWQGSRHPARELPSSACGIGQLRHEGAAVFATPRGKCRIPWAIPE